MRPGVRTLYRPPIKISEEHMKKKIIFILVFIAIVAVSALISWQFSDKQKRTAEETPVKKCEFPDSFNNYTKVKVEELTNQLPQKPNGLVYWFRADYSTWNIVHIYQFDTITNAKNHYNSLIGIAKEGGAKDISCEFKDIKNLCLYFAYPAESPTQLELTFIWQENNMLKTTTVIEHKNSEEDMLKTEKRAKEKLEVFVSEFKDCKIEP